MVVIVAVHFDLLHDRDALGQKHTTNPPLRYTRASQCMAPSSVSFETLSPSGNAEAGFGLISESCEPFGDWTASEQFRGGRTAALSALESFNLRGYAAK